MSITLVFPVGYKPVLKHGDHDQSSHGNWASGNFDEKNQGEDAGRVYGERYGVDNAGNKVGVSREEDDAIHEYSYGGYRRINEYLRGADKQTFLEPTEAKLIIENDEELYSQAIDEYSENNELGEQLTESELEDAVYQFYIKHGIELLERINNNETIARRNQKDVEALDKLIDEAPTLFLDKDIMPQKMFGDKTLYRVYSEKVLANLNEGDTIVDKGFLSTTRIDITADSSARRLLGDINPSKDVVGVILPNESKSGKGFAVDMYKTAVGSLGDISKNEKEVLLPRNTPLKFIGYQTDVGNEAKVAVFQRMDK